MQMAAATKTRTTSKPTVTKELARLLADTYATYQKTLYYHWNVTGPHFHSLHQLFEEQYQEMQPAVDVLAERIRQLGSPTPAFGEPLSSLTTVSGDRDVPAAMAMVDALVDAHEIVAESAHAVVELAEERGDRATADIATERIEAHDKAIWMLRATAS
jgi:starvation-inducible DNA-binding protein